MITKLELQDAIQKGLILKEEARIKREAEEAAAAEIKKLAIVAEQNKRMIEVNKIIENIPDQITYAVSNGLDYASLISYTDESTQQNLLEYGNKKELLLEKLKDSGLETFVKIVTCSGWISEDAGMYDYRKYIFAIKITL